MEVALEAAPGLVARLDDPGAGLLQRCCSRMLAFEPTTEFLGLVTCRDIERSAVHPQ